MFTAPDSRKGSMRRTEMPRGSIAYEKTNANWTLLKKKGGHRRGEEVSKTTTLIKEKEYGCFSSH